MALRLLLVAELSRRYFYGTQHFLGLLWLVPVLGLGTERDNDARLANFSGCKGLSILNTRACHPRTPCDVVLKQQSHWAPDRIYIGMISADILNWRLPVLQRCRDTKQNGHRRYPLVCTGDGPPSQSRQTVPWNEWTYLLYDNRKGDKQCEMQSPPI